MAPVHVDFDDVIAETTAHVPGFIGLSHEQAVALADRLEVPGCERTQWFDTAVPNAQPPPRVVSTSREISAGAETIFELIADPAEQPRWDGNDNLRQAAAGQRVHATGDVFTMTLRRGGVRENTVVEFDEGRLIAWRPNVPGRPPPGHLWRWELKPLDQDRTRVTHTYDWTALRDRSRLPRARATTVERLAASLERLAHLAEEHGAA